MGSILPSHPTPGAGHIKRRKSDNHGRINDLQPINLQTCNGRTLNHAAWISAPRAGDWQGGLIAGGGTVDNKKRRGNIHTAVTFK